MEIVHEDQLQRTKVHAKKKIMKYRAAMKVLVELNLEKSVRTCFSWDRHLAKSLSPSIILLALQDARTVVFDNCPSLQRRGMASCSIPNAYINQDCGVPEEDSTRIHTSRIDCMSLKTDSLRGISKDDDTASSRESNDYMGLAYPSSVYRIRAELPDPNVRNQIGSGSNQTQISFRSGTDDSNINDHRSVTASVQESSTYGIVCADNSSKDEKYTKELTKSIPGWPLLLYTKELTKSTPGWPLLLIKIPGTSDFSSEYEYLESSSSKGAASVPKGSTPVTPKSRFDFIFKQAHSSGHKSVHLYKDNHDKCWSKASEKLPKNFGLSLKLNSSGCQLFTHEMLKKATHQFSSENLIGEGGCSTVYKGYLPNKKLVAIKVLKQYKEAWNDFSLEVDIMSSLNHKYITPLIGVCHEENHLILVYDFLSKGSLEERLHDQGNKRSTLPWKVRFKVAVAVAEALNYLHNDCPRPVIHRDVKSSNILLSGELQPQLSDFGLAIWRPSDYATYTDVVGTFGYIAPEYVMHGRVSQKIDVYSFGVVLLELLAGRKAISSQGPNGQESLVKWAIPLLEKRNIKSLLDPKLATNINADQVRRLALAATLCIKQSPRLRPNIRQMLKLLKGKEDVRKWVNAYIDDLATSSINELGDTSLDPKLYLDLPIPETDRDRSSSTNSFAETSISGTERKRHLKLTDYLKEPLE